MNERSDETTREKLSNGTIGSRRLLLSISLVGFLVATLPPSAETVSFFGISLQFANGELQGMLIVVLIYLVAGYMVRTFTDLAGSTSSPVEKRLHEKIDLQTEDIRKRTMNRLANLFPSGNERKFHSQSFESLLNDDAINNSVYREKMLDNTLAEIKSWKEEVFVWTAKNYPDSNQELVPPIEDITEQYNTILIELLGSHGMSCRWRRWKNHPRWAAYRTIIFLRFHFFDALAPSLFSLLVIALLLGWIDETWTLELIRWMAS